MDPGPGATLRLDPEFTPRHHRTSRCHAKAQRRKGKTGKCFLRDLASLRSPVLSQGTWTLEVADQDTGDTGTLHSFSLELES
jgi:subtilisin-like proprotein convertase family protein